MPYCMHHALSPPNRHRWNRVVVFGIINMFVALSDGPIYMSLNNMYVYNMNDSFANMSHACVCVSTYSYLTSLTPHLLINRSATVGQTQFCSRCHEGSSADRVFRWSFYEHVLACTQSATSKHSSLLNSCWLSSLPGWLGRSRST